MKVNEYYKLLGISPDAGPDEIKKAHRRLVKKWHPDLFSDPVKQQEAQKKIIEINRAYQYAKNFSQIRKATRQANYTAKDRQSTGQKSSQKKSSGTTTSAKSQQRTKTTSTSASRSGKKKTSEKKATRKRHVRRNWLDEKLSGISRYLQLRHLAKRRERNEARLQEEIRKAEKVYEKKRRNMETRTNVGMYSSRFNQVVFWIASKFSGSDSLKQGLGSYRPSQKYEIELRHKIIHDRIFYSVNHFVNLSLKYVFGVFLGMQIIYNISASFFMGQMITSPISFFSTQLILFGIAVLLFLPDSLFQRMVLWKYRKIPLNQISNYFSGKKLPSPWNFWKHVVVYSKYVVVTSAIMFGYY